MKTPQETIERYVEATRRGDVNELKALFAPGSLMSGFYEGEFYCGSPDAFFDEVRDNPSPAETGADYAAEITHLEVAGNIAQATLAEKGYLGLDFTNLFHLACIDGNWLILSKTYVDQ